MLLEKSSAHQVSRSGRLDFVVLQTTDGPVHLQHGQCNLVKVSDSVLSESTMQLIHGDVFSSHVESDDFAIVDQQAWLALNQFAEIAIPARDLCHQIVHHQQGSGGDDSAEDRRIRTGHRVLYCITEQQEQSQIKGSHLTDFTLAAQPHTQQDNGVDRRRPQRDLDQNVSARIHPLYWFAVTGVGAFFGVLR